LPIESPHSYFGPLNLCAQYHLSEANQGVQLASIVTANEPQGGMGDMGENCQTPEAQALSHGAFQLKAQAQNFQVGCPSDSKQPCASRDLEQGFWSV